METHETKKTIGPVNFWFIALSMGIVAGVFPAQVSGGWSTDPAVNNPICTVSGDQINQVITSDNSGGAIVAWQDSRSGNWDIYAQRLCFCQSVIDWAANGIPICTANGDQISPAVINDNRSAAIVVWQDIRSGRNVLYAQKINFYGVIQWNANGLPLCNSESDQKNFSAISDESGGVFVVWEDNRNGNSDIYAQHLDSVGAALWGTNALAVCTNMGEQSLPRLVSDKTGGAIVTWQDKRDGDYDIYAQRMDSTGHIVWISSINGEPVCTMAEDQFAPDIAMDGSNGAIITWHDNRSTMDFNIFAQRIAPNGARQWAVDGVVLNNNVPGNQMNPKIVSDGMRGAIIAWQDIRSGNSFDIYAQRVNESGNIQWASTGTVVCSVIGNQTNPIATGDNFGGAFITWTDSRAGVLDLYSQRVSINGQMQWAENGIAVSFAAGDQTNGAVIGDGNGGAIVAWQDNRNGGNDLYAQMINEAFILAPPELKGPPFNPGKPEVLVLHNKIHYSLTNEAAVSLKLYNSEGREIARLVDKREMAGNHVVVLPAGKGQIRVSSGVHFLRLEIGKDIWIKKISIMN